jgi:histidinol-phosphatase
VDADLQFALELADAADALTLPRFHARQFVVETKADLTPVTDADRATEELLRERIARDRPGEGVVGEEHGEDGNPATRWIVDPIDGTRNYTRGVPIWATLVALERDGEFVVGVVSAPALGRRWWASRGGGAFADGARLQASSRSALAEAAVSCTYGRDLALLEPLTWHARGLGDFWSHMLVAEGALDVAVDASLKLWDYAAVVPIVTEAGGRSEPFGRQWLSTNGLLHEAVTEALA